MFQAFICKRKSYERMRSIVECAARDDGAHARVLFLTYTTRVAGGLIKISQNPGNIPENNDGLMLN